MANMIDIPENEHKIGPNRPKSPKSSKNSYFLGNILLFGAKSHKTAPYRWSTIENNLVGYVLSHSGYFENLRLSEAMV